jgi:hypothetical protein
MKLRTCILAALTLSACYGDVCVEFFDGKCPSEGGAAGTAGTGGGGSNPGGGGDGGIGGSGGNNGGGGNSGGGGEGGMTPTQCIPAEGVTIGAECGVFVQAGASGNGQQATPTANLQTAVTAASANGSRFRNVYICGSDSLAQTASLVVNNGVNIYGGLNCVTWDYNDANVPTIQGPADVAAVLVQNGSSTLQGLAVSAPNAGALGASSIGIIVEGSADLSLVSASVTSGNGQPGEAGEPFTMMATAGVQGDPGLAGCAGMVGLAGGFGGDQTNCVGSSPTAGGPGGGGTSGTSGGNGNPGDDSGGLAGAGQSGGSCTSGQSPVDIAAAGPDATSETALGTLTVNGYIPAAPGSGGVGVGGKGGGGGGGGKECTVNSNIVGPSGGGGGSGGCGGAGGPSGAGGGASFGVVLLAGAGLTISDSVVAAGSGGVGGAGAQGQEGGNGGPGGIQGLLVMGSSNPNNSAACAGGIGGKGGDGGDGSGGVGGPVAAVAAAAAGQVTPSGTNTLSAGTPGSGGPGAGAAPMGATAQSCMGVMLLESGIGTCE